MQKFILLQSVLQMLIICHVSSEPVPVHVQHNNVYHTGSPSDTLSDRIDFNEKLDYNKVKMSKLRLLLLGELFKHENAVPSVDLTCDSDSSSLYVGTKNCSCKSYPCKNPTIVSSNEISNNYRRNIFTSCNDFCCTKFKRSVSSSMYNRLFNQHENTKWNHHTWRRVAEMCGKESSQNVVPYIMHRKGTEPLCRGVLLSSKVILTTARCVYDTSLRELAIKMEYGTNKGPQYENVKLIRKMIHSNFKPEEGHHSYDVALLVLDKNLKTVSNGGYMCLPKGNTETLLSNCHISIPTHFQYPPTHRARLSYDNSHKLHLNLHKAIECDNILQVSDMQKNLYLNNGSLCGISMDDDDMLKSGPLLGGLPLTCISETTQNLITLKGVTSMEKRGESYVRGLLTRFWPGNKLTHGRDNISMFAFVDVLKYVDWINLQMEKLYS